MAQDFQPHHTSSASQHLQHYSYAANSNPDVLHFGQIQHADDHPSFEADMHREVSDLLHTQTVEVVHHSILPFGTKILQAIWSFCRKGTPDWSSIKHKARVCPHGGQQVEGLNYWETYAPVVSWHTIHLVLV